MKNLSKLLLVLFVFTNLFFAMAQQEPLEHNYFQVAPRVGYDFPTYKNNTPYIDYKGGLDLGFSLDYYWNWFGLGADVDYIKNVPKSTYPTSNLFASDISVPISATSLTEDKITRLFYGIGPNVQFRHKNGKFTAELNTRAGLASIKGGRTYLEGTATTLTGTNTYPLNFHAGYKDAAVLSLKGQLRFTYFFNKNWGIHAGGYFMQHFGVKELNESGISAGYKTFRTVTNADEPATNWLGETLSREEPCDCDISSIGVFAGLTYKFTKPKAEPKNICPVCNNNHTPHCCATCGCGLTITAKDKFSGEVLPNTAVVLKDLNGNIVQSGTTNAFGVIVFNDVIDDHYTISGKLYGVNLEDEAIEKDAFTSCKETGHHIQKTIYYTNENFILKGHVTECNNNERLQGVDIALTDQINATEKHSLSDAEGHFIFHLKQASRFTLKGRKDGYYSNKVEVLTSSYNRNQSLFIAFEMCIDPCGKAISLDHINFDLDKAEILPASIQDLERIVKLMQDNPNIKVEMSSHTDSQGSDEYNRLLSQRRADATVNYIVNRGISKDRLIARGAGESELKNTKCKNNVPCTDDEHRINRRTEFKVVCF